MLFSADNAYAILYIEAGIVDYEMMQCIEHHHCTGSGKPAQYLYSSVVEAIFIGTV